jgi:hypothetical protein
VEHEGKNQAAPQQRTRRCLRRPALALVLVFCGKLIWFLSMAPPREGLSVEDARTDVAMRRDYLLKRVASEEFGVADMPLLVASPYRQELAIATLSMTTVALTNLSFIDPGERVGNLGAARHACAHAVARDSPL